MYQTFYISPDEEIISVINKIKKSPSTENALIVSPGALILQSIINLRLLKKESEKLGKQIMIVTQNEQSRRLVEKAGILAQSSVAELTKTESDQDAARMDFCPEINGNENENAEKKIDGGKKLAAIGSKNFFDNQAIVNSKVIESQPRKPEELNNKISNPVESDRNKKKINISDILSAKKENFSPNPARSKTEIANQGGFDLHKERELEKLFRAEIEKDRQSKKPKDKSANLVSGKIKKVSIAFLSACFLVALALGSYLIFPKAEIGVLLKADVMENDLVLEGDKNISTSNLEKRIIPAQVIEKEDDLSLSFDATGKSAVSDQKARGVIAIYNEYGKNSQPLVATTRFLTSDGKLFRLVKGVTVPGMTEMDGKTEPGVIEAEVIADESGEEYNIDASEFSIPGFKGSPKYGKFYARSSQPMIGGGSTGNEITVVSEEDINLAKSKLESTLENKIKEEIKKETGEDKVILNEAISKNILESKPSIAAGVAARNFNYQAKMKMTVIIFSQEDLTRMAKEIFEEKREKGKLVSSLEKEGIKMKISKVEIEYGQSDADFESGKIIIKAASKVALEPEINLENLKKELLGKNDAQVREALKNYPQVDKIEIEYWPKFFSKQIPRFKKRVEVKAVSSSPPLEKGD
ncbi:hypothetical protein J7J13_02795 [bacterium]|nr:hypothetical protein [bacterium]